jgi:glycosyltransferase involved in cell wall biosynthesis
MAPAVAPEPTHMAQTTSVSVILPVYNHARFLPRALEALAAQTRTPDEIIVIDDASSDRSYEIAKDFAPRFTSNVRYTVLRNETNLGVNRTLNRALDVAMGDYVACTGADDWVRPRFIEAMSVAAQQFPAASIITSQYTEYFEAEDRLVEHASDSELGLWFIAENRLRFVSPVELSALLERAHIALHFNASVIRAEVLRRIEGFDPALKWHADWFAIYAIALRCGFAVVPESLAVFRVASGTYSASGVHNRKRQSEVCHAVCDKLAHPNWIDIRARLAATPSPLSPLVRGLVPALVSRPRDWDLLVHVAVWWLNEARKGRRPALLRSLARRLGFDIRP